MNTTGSNHPHVPMSSEVGFASKRKGLEGDKENKCCIKDLNLTASIALGVDPCSKSILEGLKHLLLQPQTHNF